MSCNQHTGQAGAESAVEGTITAAKRINYDLLSHKKLRESSLKQGKFPEEGRNIWVYYKWLPTVSPTKQLNRLNYHISAIAFTNHVVPWLVKVSRSSTVCYLTTFVLLYVHPPQTGTVFPNTVKFNLFTIQFTYVAYNLTADNFYHDTMFFFIYILSACSCHIG